MTVDELLERIQSLRDELLDELHTLQQQLDSPDMKVESLINALENY